MYRISGKSNKPNISLMVKIEVERENSYIDNILTSLLKKKSHKSILSQTKEYLNCNLDVSHRNFLTFPEFTMI